MQYQGVITADEIIFVDAQDYAVRDGEGGRLIMLAWQLVKAEARDSLNAPVPVDIVYYHDGIDELQRRLCTEFSKAMDLMLERQLEASGSPHRLKVVPIGGKSSPDGGAR